MNHAPQVSSNLHCICLSSHKFQVSNTKTFSVIFSLLNFKSFAVSKILSNNCTSFGHLPVGIVEISKNLSLIQDHLLQCSQTQDYYCMSRPFPSMGLHRVQTSSVQILGKIFLYNQLPSEIGKHQRLKCSLQTSLCLSMYLSFFSIAGQQLHENYHSRLRALRSHEGTILW
jgi:hypothetical protein